MIDYIDRQAAIEKLTNNLTYMHTFGADRSIDLIEELPSADVQPVRHGKWEEENSRPSSWAFYCSECKRTAYDPQPHRMKGFVKRCRYAYCPNCGARMDGGQNE